MQQIPVTLYCAGFFCAVLYIPFREAVLLENYLQISSSAGSCYGHRHFPLCYFNSIVTVLLLGLFCLLSYNVVFNGYNNYMNFLFICFGPWKESPSSGEGGNALFIHMYGVCWAPVVKRIIISTRKERREKKTRNKQGLVALVNARKSKELLIILQTAANSNWKLRAWKIQRRK